MTNLADRPTFDLLVAEGTTASGTIIPPETDEPGLGLLLAHPTTSRRDGAVAGAWVRANMIATVDGAAWGHDHRSGSINGPADLRVFEVVRALADVVVVGAGTVRAEGYGTLKVPEHLRGLRGEARCADELVLAVVTRAGEVPAHLLADPHVLVVTSAEGAAHLGPELPSERLVVAGTDDVDLRAALTDLAGRGLGRILTEGGPHLLADLLADGLVDDLCVTTSPTAVGPGAGRIVAGDPGRPAADLRLATLLRARDVLVARWRVA